MHLVILCNLQKSGEDVGRGSPLCQPYRAGHTHHFHSVVSGLAFSIHHTSTAPRPGFVLFSRLLFFHVPQQRMIHNFDLSRDSKYGILPPCTSREFSMASCPEAQYSVIVERGRAQKGVEHPVTAGTSGTVPYLADRPFHLRHTSPPTTCRKARGARAQTSMRSSPHLSVLLNPPRLANHQPFIRSHPSCPLPALT